MDLIKVSKFYLVDVRRKFSTIRLIPTYVNPVNGVPRIVFMEKFHDSRHVNTLESIKNRVDFG